MGKVSVVFENITTVKVTAVTKIRIQLFDFCGENLNNLRTKSGKYYRIWFTKQTTRNYRIDKVVESDHFDMYRFGTYFCDVYHFSYVIGG